MHLEIEEKKGPAAKLAVLRKMGLVDYAIDYAAESGDFEQAFSLAETAKATSKLPEIHLKHAMHLEVQNHAHDLQKLLFTIACKSPPAALPSGRCPHLQRARTWRAEFTL
jgi:hypothetical protein